MHEYIEKEIESPTGHTAIFWQVWKVEMILGENVKVNLHLSGWKDAGAFLSGKSIVMNTIVQFDHAELLPEYGTTFSGLLAKILADEQFKDGKFKTVE